MTSFFLLMRKGLSGFSLIPVSYIDVYPIRAYNISDKLFFTEELWFIYLLQVS